MKTASEREAEFRRELNHLLDKYDAEIDITDDGKDYGMHTGICEIYLPGKYDDETHECILEPVVFNL